MHAEMPSLTKSAYSTTAYNPTAAGLVAGSPSVFHRRDSALEEMIHRQAAAAQGVIKPQLHQASKPMTIRIIKAYIADPNDNLPLDKRVLYSGPEKLTDLTDQELFFEIPINDLLKAHNEVRAKTVDKKASEKFGRDIFLEPVRIRDLKMVVVDIATF